MPRGKKKRTGTPNPGQSDGKGLTKKEGVERALAELVRDAQPLAIQQHIKERYGLDMERSHISNYKTNLLKQGAGRRTAVRKSEGRAAAPSPAAANGFSLDEIRAVKEIVDRIGAEKVRQLAEALAK